jgi:fucose permease
MPALSFGGGFLFLSKFKYVTLHMDGQRVECFFGITDSRGCDLKESVPEKRVKTPISLTISMYLLFFCYALSATITGPLIPDIMAEYNISFSQSGLISLLIALGGVLGILTGGLVADRFRKPMLIHASVYSYSASMLAMYFVPSYVWLLAIFFFMGFCTRVLDTTGNGYLVDIHEHRRSFYMSLMHASYALGAVVGPVLTSTVLKGGYDWKSVFLVVGVLCTTASVFYTVAQQRAKKRPMPELPPANMKKFFWIKDKQFYILCGMSFVYCGFTAALAAWMPTFMQKELAADTMLSGLPISLLWVGILLGRLLYPAVISRFSAKRFYLAGSALTLVIYALSVTVNSPVFYVVAFFFPGFLLGNLVPFSIVLGCSWHPAHSGTVSSYILMSATLGFLVIPPALGYISDAIGLYGMIVLCAVMPAALIALSALVPGEARDASCAAQPDTIPRSA